MSGLILDFESERFRRAAPDLFEALEFFFNIMHDYESSLDKGYVRVAMEQARQALARARSSAA